MSKAFIKEVLDRWVRALRSVPAKQLKGPERVLRDLLAKRRAFTRSKAVTLDDFAEAYLVEDQMPGVSWKDFSACRSRFNVLTARLRNQGLRNLDTNTFKVHLKELDERRRCKILIDKVRKVMSSARKGLLRHLVEMEDCPLFVASVSITNTGSQKGYLIPVTVEVIDELRRNNQRKAATFSRYVAALESMQSDVSLP